MGSYVTQSSDDAPFSATTLNGASLTYIEELLDRLEDFSDALLEVRDTNDELASLTFTFKHGLESTAPIPEKVEIEVLGEPDRRTGTESNILGWRIPAPEGINTSNRRARREWTDFKRRLADKVQENSQFTGIAKEIFKPNVYIQGPDEDPHFVVVPTSAPVGADPPVAAPSAEQSGGKNKKRFPKKRSGRISRKKSRKSRKKRRKSRKRSRKSRKT